MSTREVLESLGSIDSSVRLRAALAAGTTPDPGFVDPLITRCAIEPDFFVRDMLTWALTRHAASRTVPSLIAETHAERAQARSQALHTLSKIGDRSAWPAITAALLSDPDDAVARSAWRAAAVLVPEGEKTDLARVLATQLGRTQERITAETGLLARLRQIDAADPASWDDVLQLVALLQSLGSESAGRRQRAALAAVDGLSAETLAESALAEADPNVAGALRWALAQLGNDGLPTLAQGLRSAAAEVRLRALQSIAEIATPAATTLLKEAHDTSSDVVVRRRAALALGVRGTVDAVPTLIDMIVENDNDADAADALSAIASEPAVADQIAARLVAHLADDAAQPAARLRLLQALADIPGQAASRALGDLSHDHDPAVAHTATYVLGLRETH